MPARDRSQWSEAYRRRIERAEARGLSRQEARGHRAREHVERRERAQLRSQGVEPPTRRAPPKEPPKRDLAGLSTSDKAYIRRFAAEQAARQNPPADGPELAAQMRGYAARVGMEKFRAEARRTRAMHREYIGALRRNGGGGWEPRGMTMLDAFAADGGFEDTRWYFYH